MKSNPTGGFPVLPSLAVPLTASPTSHSPKLRTSSTSSQPRGMKRAASSPNMQQEDPTGSSDASAAAAALAAEKKRNKLGYHRTSVACAHCRRRKIRCLVAPDDTQGRCQNCIRLKKDCNFYPVDQQPTNERARKSAVRGQSQSSSSPVAPNATQADHVNQYPPPPVPIGYPPLASMPGPGMGMDTGPYHASPMRSATWDPSYMESPMATGGQMSESGTPGYWKSPTANDYAYTSQPESARSVHFPGHYTPTRQDSWAHGMPPAPSSSNMHPLAPSHQPIQVQQRSVSLQHDHPSGMYGAPSQISESPYYGGPPSLYASTGSPATSVSLSDGTSAPGQTQMHYAQTQGWDPSKAGMEYGANAGWYAEAPGMSHGPEGSQGWSHNPGNFKPE